jgi:hypothetical protein
MKAQIDREQIGEKRVKGVVVKLSGRIRGVNRGQVKVVKVGKQNQQDRLSRVE